MGILVLSVIVSFIPIIGNLIALILLWPALVRAGYLVARQGQSSFGEAFGDLSLLLKVFVYYLILWLIPEILIGVGYILVGDSGGAESILVILGSMILFILNLFGWAGPYAILSGRAGILMRLNRAFPSLHKTLVRSS